MVTRALRGPEPQWAKGFKLAAAAVVLIISAGILGLSQAPPASAQCYYCGYGGYNSLYNGLYGGYNSLYNGLYGGYNSLNSGYSPYYGYNSLYGYNGYNSYGYGNYFPYEYNGYVNGAYNPTYYSSAATYPYSYYNNYAPTYSNYTAPTYSNYTAPTYSSSYAPATTVTVSGAPYGNPGYLDTTGSYCNLPSGGQAWVPSGASAASYGCTS